MRDPAVFTAVLRTVPVYAAWLDALDPVSPVFPMGGLHNTLRRLVAGRTPVAAGLAAVGDSVCTTNPTLGRGLSMALRGAAPYDPLIFRAFCQVMGMACDPGERYTDPAIVARTQDVIRRHGSAPPLAQPTREQLLTALGGAG